MNHNCEYAGSEHCMCNICQSVRETMRETKKITKEEVDALFREAEKVLEKCGKDKGCY